ncbi:phage tail protein [Burkholderia lata]|nr:phage tail protein [Burkholderia lata]
MYVSTGNSSATFTADEIVVETALGGGFFRLANFNRTINLATTGAGGVDTGSAPSSGYVALYAIYNPTTQATALLATNATSAVAPNVYGGSNMPSGYTASALVSVWPTTGSGQFVTGYQQGRTVYLTPGNFINSSVQQGSTTSLSIAGSVPLNAKSIAGCIFVTSTTPANCIGSLAATSTGVGQQTIAVNGSTGIEGTFSIPLLTPQTIYYTATVTSGTMTFIAYPSSYTF